ncbi:TPA: hypothetical protein ACID4C_004526, partial [Pseudomonas aeruginosa]
EKDSPPFKMPRLNSKPLSGPFPIHKLLKNNQLLSITGEYQLLDEEISSNAYPVGSTLAIGLFQP